MIRAICPAPKYRELWVGDRHVREHVLVAEAALGKRLRKGAVVHHVDGDRSNNAPSNLVVCDSQRYHNLLHARTRAINACGSANARICRVCRKYDRPEALIIRVRLSGDRKGSEYVYHATCQRERNRARSAAA